MPVLIDGDNVLHALRGTLTDAEHAGRAWLCRLLTSWDPTGRRRVTVYFDGVRPSSPADGPLPEGPLAIHYSGARSADEWIIEAIDTSSAPRSLMVVSSDRQIRTAARRRRARSVDSQKFVEQMMADLHRAQRTEHHEPREKLNGLDPDDSEAWLDVFDVEQEPNNSDDEFGLLQ
jgi:hypothetical protein